MESKPRNSLSHLNGCCKIVLLGALVCSLPVLSKGRTFGYDGAGRVVWATQSSGQTTTFSYDANGNLETIGSIIPGDDTDNDGMPDYFEVQFSGSKTALDPVTDEDQDGKENLLEYAFLRKADRSDGYAIAVIDLTDPDPVTGEEFHTMTYLRPISGTLHLEYSTEISFDLTTWLTGLPDVIETVVTPKEGGVEEVTVRWLAPAGSSEKLFMRLSAEQP